MTSLEEKELSKLGSKGRNYTQRKRVTDSTTKNGNFLCVSEKSDGEHQTEKRYLQHIEDLYIKIHNVLRKIERSTWQGTQRANL